jgi:acetamidase/formamidase
MLGSILVDLRINQVVDPKKGVRASIPVEYLSIEDLLE